jgi:hypothetical protein
MSDQTRVLNNSAKTSAILGRAYNVEVEKDPLEGRLEQEVRVFKRK